MTADSTAFSCVLDVRASLGECPLWSIAEQALYWIDINAPSLNRFDPLIGENVAMPMPESIGCYAFRDGGGFVVALRSGVWLCNPDGRLVRRVADAPYDTTHFRFNDGRCDLQGRFVVGTMNEKRDANGAALYRLDGDFALTRLFGGMTISNGLAWSPDGRTMYHADTPAQTIRAFDYDEASGTPSHARAFAHWTGAGERPDGGTVDRAGHYWAAHYGGGKLVELAADGVTVAEHPLPAMCPTMCAFGGADLRTLFVTTARQKRDAAELARFPQSGGIFAMRVETPGMPEAQVRA
ncbi:MAG TPA: SMP-30/gluconolactonase/LRE family protein [Casimicrobiaceae bacterium]|nr:SMP-30/gluconolactonase/LRE family protein [Casimicrobiaceae bacterium]